jgi:phenylacetate-CoA ligase
MSAPLAPSTLAVRDQTSLFTVLPAPHPSRQAIETEQLDKLRGLLDLIAASNPFYARKNAGVGLKRSIGSLEDFSRNFPFTTKEELMADQRRFTPYGTDLVYPLNSYTRCHQTSGSSGGTPLRWLDTAESWSRLLDHWSHIYRAAGVTHADRLFFAFSFGPFLGFWTAYEAALRQGSFCLPGGAMNSTARLRAILDHGITVLCATPTYAVRLGETAREEGIDLTAGHLKVIITAGEPGGSIPATRARLAALWPGARAFDHHGMTEVGPVSYECPAHPGVLHIIETSYLAEIIDPATHLPATPGQTGELVLTTLDRLASPLLRYRTGDLVKPRPEGVCACGRSEMALEGGILGRTDDMVVVRGVNIYPSAVEDIIRACEGVTEFQVTLAAQSPMLELSVTIEPSPECTDGPGLVQRLEQAFKTALALRVPVRTTAPGTLPRFEMKSKRWVRV